MAFFDADLPVNNSKLTELEILGKNVQVEEKKGILYLSKNDITIELTGVFKETNDRHRWNGRRSSSARPAMTNPTWDISGLNYDFDKLFTEIADGKLDKVIEEMFEKKDPIWGSHFDDKLSASRATTRSIGWRGNDRINGGRGKDKLVRDKLGRRHVRLRRRL